MVITLLKINGSICSPSYRDFVTINVYIKFDRNSSIDPRDTENKQNLKVNQGS